MAVPLLLPPSTMRGNRALRERAEVLASAANVPQLKAPKPTPPRGVGRSGGAGSGSWGTNKCSGRGGVGRWGGAAGWCPARRDGNRGHQSPGRLVMANYMPPWGEKPPYFGPRHKIPRFGQILF